MNLNHRRRAAVSALALLLATTPAGTAFGQQPDDATTKEARARFQEGVGRFDKGQYEAARAAFLQAYALRKHPAVLLNLAQSSLRSNRPLEAAKYFQQYLREATTATPAQRADAERGLAEARTKLGRLEVSAPPGSEISVDGNVVGAAPLSEPVDVEAGNHTVKARLTDGSSETKSVSARAGEKLPVQLTHTKDPAVAPVPVPATAPSPAPAPAPTPAPAPVAEERPAGGTFEVQPNKKSFRPKTMVPVYIGAGVAVAGAATAVAFYVFKQDALDSAKRTANLIQNPPTPPAGNSQTCNAANPGRFAAACKALQDDIDRSNTDNTIANVGVGVGIAGAALALGWLFFGPKKDVEPQVGTWRLPLVTPMLGDARGVSAQAAF
ncbi:MAG: PEGA domain-containing protein [Myxococcales bacterium]|nr:PEGA domain-containing protein [Myxococcales bacterium]